MQEPIRVILVDDHVIVRDGLRSLLELRGRARVVAEASDAEEALECVGRTPCDVVMLDLNLPGRDGIWCTQQLKKSYPHLPVLVLSMHNDEDTVTRSVEAGASGYVLKTASRDEILTSLQEVTRGGTYVHPGVVGHLVNRFVKQRNHKIHCPTDLTDRETCVLRLLAQGLNNQEIADQLIVSVSTVKSHLQSLYRKFNVKDRTQLAILVVQQKMVPEKHA